MHANHSTDDSTLGVLGGMGPLATTAFMEKVIERTPAREDQDHVRMIVLNDPTVPDRSAAILDGGEDPVGHLRENARELERAGADFIAVPCNTFHYFYEDVADAVDATVLHMIRETAAFLDERVDSRVGLLATSGTIRTGIYHEALAERGLDVVEPRDVDAVMDAIYRIKAGEAEGPRSVLTRSYEALLADGAEAVIAGCTEIPLALEGLPALVDPMAVMAGRCVLEATGEREPLPALD